MKNVPRKKNQIFLEYFMVNYLFNILIFTIVGQNMVSNRVSNKFVILSLRNLNHFYTWKMQNKKKHLKMNAYSK